MIDYETLYRQCKDLNVLFVEDYLPLQEKLVEILKEFFNTIVTANNGEDALAKYIKFNEVHQKTYDIIITDIRMPVKDGLSLTKDILKIDKNQIIIVLSAHQESSYLLEFINLGIAQFVTKPIESEKLLEVLNKITKNIQRVDVESTNTDEIHLSDSIVWNKKLNRLSSDNVEIKLTKNELLVMELLIKNIEYICRIDTIIEYFYNNKGISMNHESIRNLMSRLRRKLPSDIISNLYGLGYKLSKV